MFLLAAISLGFLGSFHCVGMCGPIALALPLGNKRGWAATLGTLTYNLGRMTAYATIGLVFGLFGQGFARLGLQNILSISIGLILLLGLFLPQIKWLSVGLSWWNQLTGEIKNKLRELFGISSYRSLFTIGWLNGFLPCGLVYVGIAGAVATGNSLYGAAFMAAFGLGTLPAMSLVTLTRHYLTNGFRAQLRKIAPVVVVIMAVLLIIRGLNLGIPYLSPDMAFKGEITAHQCCHKPQP